MGKMAKLRHALRECVGKPITLAQDHPRSLAFLTAIGKLAAGELSDKEVRAVFGEGDNGLDIQLGAYFKYEISDDGDDGYASRRAAALAAPVVIPGGGKGKSIAVVSMRGVALYDMEYQPYCYSTLNVAQQMRSLTQNADIGTIVMIVDSPGGSVTGTPEAGDAIFAAAKKKRVVALVSPLAASAAYWMCSQASEIIATPTADVGSIGVFMMHVDYSKMLDAAGIKPTFVFAGDHKVDGNPYEPLSADALAYYQAEVDNIYGAFLAAVARGRGVDAEAVKANYGQGRTMMAPAAKKAGMIDTVATLDVAMNQCGISSDLMDSRARMRGEAESATELTEAFAAEVSRYSPEAVAAAFDAAAQSGMSAILAAAQAGGNKLNGAGEAHAESLIASGDVDRNSAWSFSAEDGNALLGKDGNDWANYGKFHLGIDTGAKDNTKARYKYPFGKGGKLYRSALTAIDQRAAGQGDASIGDAAKALLEKVDKNKDNNSSAALSPEQMAAAKAFNLKLLGGEPYFASDEWPEFALILASLTVVIDSRYVQLDGGTVIFTLKNASAKYEKVHEFENGTWICRRIVFEVREGIAEATARVEQEEGTRIENAKRRQRRLSLLRH